MLVAKHGFKYSFNGFSVSSFDAGDELSGLGPDGQDHSEQLVKLGYCEAAKEQELITPEQDAAEIVTPEKPARVRPRSK